MIKRIFPLIFSCLLLSIYPTPTRAGEGTVLENIAKTNLLRVGIREDAAPFGYRNINNELTGLCLDFVELLRHKIQKRTGQKIISIKLFRSTLFNRFELVEENVVDLECGPNTINPLSGRNVSFSAPFFVTGLQFLIGKNELKNFNTEGGLENQTLGVLRGTMTEKILAERYPTATIKQFQGVTGRRRGVQALQQGRINAFASDGILLIGEAILQGLVLGEEYKIVPERPLDCEYYGFILPPNDPQWRELVNSVIVEILRDKKISEKWVSVVFPYIKELTNFCIYTRNLN